MPGLDMSLNLRIIVDRLFKSIIDHRKNKFNRVSVFLTKE